MWMTSNPGPRANFPQDVIQVGPRRNKGARRQLWTIRAHLPRSAAQTPRWWNGLSTLWARTFRSPWASFMLFRSLYIALVIYLYLPQSIQRIIVAVAGLCHAQLQHYDFVGAPGRRAIGVRALDHRHPRLTPQFSPAICLACRLLSCRFLRPLVHLLAFVHAGVRPLPRFVDSGATVWRPGTPASSCVLVLHALGLYFIGTIRW